jgi:Ca2+/Na+ antiporter
MAEAPKVRAGKGQAARQAERRGRPQDLLVFGKRNVLMLVAGIVVVMAGYIFLGQGSISVAPILLVLGYCVVIPLSIILWVKKPEDVEKPGDTTPTGTGE